MKNNEIIYQIFPRNYSKEGTFNAIKNDLNRIKDLGVDIIYLMPIHEIGIKNRKGTYGSPYAIKDYFSISKDLGSKEDFVSLINEIHKIDMKIIIDMVFNHTAPDNVLLKDHEDYYFHKNGKLGNRVGDWSDIVDLDTHLDKTQDYLVGVLEYYVNLGVDGFRFDVCSMIDINVFKKARKKLGNNIIFIGESVDHKFGQYLRSINDTYHDDNELYQIFDSLYNYNYYHDLFGYINKKNPLDPIIVELNNDNANPRLLCLENHDVERIANHLNYDELSRFLDFFSFIKGQMFIYAGQEYGNKHKPELFEKDPVDFSYIDEDIKKLYLKAIETKKKQKEIIAQRFIKLSDNSISVTLTYSDKTEETRDFIL